MNIRKKKKSITAMLLCMLTAACLLLAGCSSGNAAEARAAEDIEALRAAELDEVISAELDELLTDEGREYYEEFQKKAADFDYEITGSEGNGDAVTVHVRITTYDFGSEYLKSWAEFLEEADASGAAEYDSSRLYELLFRNLAGLQNKEYIGRADVVCTSDENGEWTSDAETNTALRDALFGGMISEMSSLAGL